MLRRRRSRCLLSRNQQSELENEKNKMVRMKKNALALRACWDREGRHG